ncbi:MAG: hypothetical protein Q7R31_02465 [Candidatus Levybacteria bacterium]|nr:hypothetical protein [Candidatus Levybacteria bacterium]
MKEGREFVSPQEGALPKEKIYGLLAAFGNSEAKAFTIIVMGQGKPYDKGSLHRDLIKLQGEKPVWELDKNTPFQYCMISFLPEKLIKANILDSNGLALEYVIIDYGKKTGVSFAGGLSKWSIDHPNFSLYGVFGSTNSSFKEQEEQDKKRSPEMRLKVLRQLAASHSRKLRQADLVKALNESRPLIGSHLKNLARKGVIQYENVGRGREVTHYKLKGRRPNEMPKPYRGEKIATERVYEVLQENMGSYVSIKQLQNLLIKKYPEYKNRKSLYKLISGVAHDFERQKYAKCKKFEFGFQSQINMSKEQQEAIASLVNLIDNFQKGDWETIREGHLFAQKLLSDPKLVSLLMQKAREASPFARKTEKEEMYRRILEIIQENPNVTANRAQKILKKNYDKDLEIEAVQKLLREVVNRKLAISRKTKFGKQYVVEHG